MRILFVPYVLTHSVTVSDREGTSPVKVLLQQFPNIHFWGTCPNLE